MDEHRPDPEARRTEVALWIFETILPLVKDEHPPGGKSALRREIAARSHRIPHSSRTRVSVATLKRWEKRYREGGFEALKPARRADRGEPRAISPETLERAEALKREQPHRSARSIARILKLNRADPIPEGELSERTLRRWFARRGLTTRALVGEVRARRRFEKPHFGDLWQGDEMDGVYLPWPEDPTKKRQTTLFALLDDHTRLVPYAAFYWDARLPRFQHALQQAILRYGVPASVYLDLAQIHTSGHFRTTCGVLGIRRRLGTAGEAEGRGKIEAFFRFLQQDFLPELRLSPVATLEELNEALWAWLEVVYHQKEHSATEQTPLARYEEDPSPNVRPVDPEVLRVAFLWRETRQVAKTATFAFRGNRYRVQGHLVGQRIQVRYDPFDLTRLEVWFPASAELGEPAFVQLAEVDDLHRPHHPDVQPDPQPTPPPGAPSSGIDYLSLLRAERQRLLGAGLEGIRFTRLRGRGDDHEAP